MEIEYLYHSGVSVRHGRTLLVFDYYLRGISEDDIRVCDNVYVFVSHGHRDHFDREIFSWTGWNGNIEYIISYDTGLEEGENVHVMEPHETYETGNLSVYTLDSTDDGVAFAVTAPWGRIFHAGDLNWWHWEGESRKYNEGMATKFRNEMDRMKGNVIDIAFIPVDKRLETSQYLSIDHIMGNLDVRKVCPIHFWDDWKYIDRVRQDLKDREYYDRIYFYGR